MTRARTGIALLLIQLLLVLSVAGKYLYDRKTRPRVWSRAIVVDPSLPLRGRYLALKLLVDACALPRDEEHYTHSYVVGPQTVSKGFWHWNVSLSIRDGELIISLDEHPRNRKQSPYLEQKEDQPCNRIPLTETVDFFIPDTAKLALPLKKDDELWVEVTMPKSGPPRPIQLALSHSGTFEPLHLEAEGLPTLRLP